MQTDGVKGQSLTKVSGLSWGGLAFSHCIPGFRGEIPSKVTTPFPEQ